MEENLISFYKGQIPVRGPGQTKCVYHKALPLCWYCETCCDVICLRCAKNSHKDHDITELSKITPDNKRKIHMFIEETEQKKLIEIEHEMISTQDSLDKHLNQCEDLDDENTKLLNGYKTELGEKLADLKEHLKQCKETVQTGTDIQVFDLTKRLLINSTLPEKPFLGSVDFSPNFNRKEIQEEAFGKVTLNPSGHSQSPPSTSPDQSNGTLAQHSQDNRRNDIQEETFGKAARISSGKSQRQTSTSPGQSDKTSVQENPLSSELQCSEKGSTDTCQDPEKVLLPQIKIISEWKSPCTINAICPSGGDGMWTSDCLTTKLKRLTCQGDIQDQIRSRFHISDNSVSPTTRNLWTCSESVEELISGKLTERFKTNDEPRCLCVTSDEHILVGTKHRISEYTPDGKPGITTEISLFKKAVVCSPWRISQCPLSDNVAVVDRDEEKDGGKDKPAVIVLDRQLQHLYRYGESQHNSMTNCQCFDPWDLTYDSQRFLVVADYKNKHLHLLSGDGQYLRLLHTDIDCPRAVCVDTEGVLWAVFGLVSMTYQKVKRLQYTGF